MSARYLTEFGKTHSNDPKRLVWYSASCGYYTEDWGKLGSLQAKGNTNNPRSLFSSGIPCCPKCGMVGLKIEYSKWEEKAKEEDKKNPGYQEFISKNRETCFSKSILGLVGQFKLFIEQRKIDEALRHIIQGGESNYMGEKT